MLTLTLLGQPIPIPLNFSMRLTWKSPACDFGKIPSGYGLGLSFPINEHTRALFGNPKRFAKYRPSTGSGTDQKFPGFEVRFSGVLLMAGSLSIASASGGNYEATLIDEIGVLGEDEKERDILEFTELNKDVAWSNSANFSPDTHPYCCFPVINTAFFKEKGIIKTMTVKVLNDKDELIDSTEDIEALTYCFGKSPVSSNVNALNPDNTVKEISNVILTIGDSYKQGALTVLSPFMFLVKIINDALKECNFSLLTGILDTSDILRMLCIYNNFDITNTTYQLKINDSRTIKLPYGHGEIEIGIPESIRSVGKLVLGYDRTTPTTFKMKNMLPKMKIGELLLSTQNMFNLCFHFLPNATVNAYSREAIITGLATDLDRYFLGTWNVGEKKCVALNFTHDNDEKDLVFAERFTDITERMADIKDPVANLTALLAVTGPTEGDIRWMTSENCYYEYRLITQATLDAAKNEITNDVLGWEEFSIGLQNGWYQHGRKEVEEIKTSWSTCFGDSTNTLVNQQGNMNSWKAKLQAFAPRLLIYAGNNHGGNETATFSLDYEKAGKGILPTFWKNWNPFWANRLEVSGSFDLPVNVLRHVIYNICNKYRTREGEFLIEEMSCDLYVDRIGETEIKGFKVE